jgi:hypothetical protein
LFQSNPVFAILTFFQSFVDSKLLTFKIFNAQDQNLGRPQAAHAENPQDDVLARHGMRQKGAELLHA